MNESEFRQKLKELLEHKVGDNYFVYENMNLIYKVIINNKLEYEPNDPKNPKRGEYAFQTDITITKKENNLPLVVIEIKYGDFITHDVLTYSTKALRHKEIYPYLRYGFIVGGIDKIQNKFFTHNVGFDFAFALKEFDEVNLKSLYNIIQEQIKSSELLLDIFTKKKKVKYIIQQ